MSGSLAHLGSFASLAEPTEVVFFTGAGISVDAPTCCLPGVGYVKRVLETAFLDVDPARLFAVFQACEMPGGAPRFEVVLDSVLKAHGPDVLRALLFDMVDAPPNSLHKFFARHLDSGGRHVTANVDQAIERAQSELGHSGRRQPCHFHSTLQPEGDLVDLGVVLSRVRSGLGSEIAAELDATVFAPETRAVVFAGYSGSDYFDVNPYLLARARAGAFRNKQVFWLAHTVGSTPAAIRESGVAPALASAMEALDVDIVTVSGSTRQILTQLALRWGFPPMRTPGHWHERWEPASVQLDPDRKWEAQARLYHDLRFARPLRQMASGHENLVAQPPFADMFADADWHDGDYRSAKRRWTKAWPGPDTDSLFLRAERVTACDWVAGAWGRARRRLDQLILASASASPPPSLTVRVKIADTYARLLGHMLRDPIARNRVSAQDQVRALTLLPTIADAKAAGLSSEWLHRIAHGRSKLGEETDEDDLPQLGSSALADSHEASSLAGSLMYQ